MALSTPSTPRNPFATPKRIIARTPIPAETPECFKRVCVETPSSTKKLRNSREKVDQVSNLTVAVRIRPMNSRELACIKATDVITVRNQDLIVRSTPVGNAGVSLDHIFHYDHVLWSGDESSSLYINQEEVFLTLGQPLLKSAFKGYNACLFAYGQTGSGKSYSMMGRHVDDFIDIDSEEHSGITPRFCRELFSRISKLENIAVSVEVSYFEIYNEKIHDLLSVNASSNRTALKVREHPEWGPYVVDLSVHNVKSYSELRDWLILGNKNRAIAATAMNEKSSRSHCLFAIELCLSDGTEDSNSSRRSKVSLVDLAGSERLGSSHGTDEKLKQGVSINKSLLTLGKVIAALAEQKKSSFVPYRESVLTWLLKESLGGNSLTSMLATISPANVNTEETLATLRYACQARSIVNRARINESPHDRLIRELKAEVGRLRALRKDYERNSISTSSSLIHFDDSSIHSFELEELKARLSQTETQLQEAELNWQQRFIEMRETQMKELADAEKHKEELESHVRVLGTLDMNMAVEFAKTDFLEAVDGILGGDSKDKENDNYLETLKETCRNAGFDFEFTVNNGGTVTIMNKKTNKTARCSMNKINSFKNIDNIPLFINKLIWADDGKVLTKKISKSDVTSSMNQIYESLAVFKPLLKEEDNLRILFAKVNKNLQSFESALLNSIGQKTVTFEV